MLSYFAPCLYVLYSYETSKTKCSHKASARETPRNASKEKTLILIIFKFVAVEEIKIFAVAIAIYAKNKVERRLM